MGPDLAWRSPQRQHLSNHRHLFPAAALASGSQPPESSGKSQCPDCIRTNQNPAEGAASLADIKKAAELHQKNPGKKVGNHGNFNNININTNGSRNINGNGNGWTSSRSSSRAAKPGRGPSQPMGSFHHPPLLRWFIPSSATRPSACRLFTRSGHGFTRSGTSDRCAPGLP